MRYEGGQFYLKSEEEMRRLFPYAQEALDNTHAIAQRCNVEIEFGVTKVPRFHVPEGYSAWEYLQKLCFEGLEKRYPDQEQRDVLKEKLIYELGVIRKMGYVDYFLIVWDFIHFARSNDIMVGRAEVRRLGAWFPIVWVSPTLIPSATIFFLSGSECRACLHAGY